MQLLKLKQKSLLASLLLGLLSLSLFSLGDTSQADDKVKARKPNELELKGEGVYIFKDGYCLIIKEGAAKTDAEGNVFTDEVPDSAILGSFWAIPQDKTVIRSMVAGWVETEEETSKTVNCQTMMELIKANLGRQCSFDMGKDSRMGGQILKILSNDQLADNERANVLRRPSAAMSSAVLRSVSQVGGSFFLLRTETGDVVVAANAISNLKIENITSEIEKKTTVRSKHKRLKLKCEQANADVRLKLIYFRPGIRWIPTYRVNLTDSPYESGDKEGLKAKLAQLSMQAEILNEAEDLMEVPMSIVVGVPNFRFKSIPSPMVLEAKLRNVLVQAAPQIMGNQSQQLSNALYTQRSAEFRSSRAAGSDERTEISVPESLTGKSGGNDLFVYKLKPLSLKKGERATVPILSTKVAYRDIYTWDVNLAHAESYAATAADAPSPLVLSKNKVWRQIEMINNTDIPWTTGAAMFVDGFQPLAQELLTYTSPGGICRVPITVSVDLRAKAMDAEVQRNLKVLRHRGYDYARVKGKVELELANNKNVAVPVEVNLRFGGKGTSASDDGQITLLPYQAKDWKDRRGDTINNSTLIKWQATVEPGECFKPTALYEFLIRQ